MAAVGEGGEASIEERGEQGLPVEVLTEALLDESKRLSAFKALGANSFNLLSEKSGGMIWQRHRQLGRAPEQWPRAASPSAWNPSSGCRASENPSASSPACGTLEKPHAKEQGSIPPSRR